MLNRKFKHYHQKEKKKKKIITTIRNEHQSLLELFLHFLFLEFSQQPNRTKKNVTSIIPLMKQQIFSKKVEDLSEIHYTTCIYAITVSQKYLPKKIQATIRTQSL
jgi:hypothetical protein